MLKFDIDVAGDFENPIGRLARLRESCKAAPPLPLLQHLQGGGGRRRRCHRPGRPATIKVTVKVTDVAEDGQGDLGPSTTMATAQQTRRS